MLALDLYCWNWDLAWTSNSEHYRFSRLVGRYCQFHSVQSIPFRIRCHLHLLWYNTHIEKPNKEKTNSNPTLCSLHIKHDYINVIRCHAILIVWVSNGHSQTVEMRQKQHYVTWMWQFNMREISTKTCQSNLYCTSAFGDGLKYLFTIQRKGLSFWCWVAIKL